ncbi:unnamed protein product [Zymoseptoria tritici ST99CH_3D1]|nr:unnamed protein product [Zymoseptoria tritici ST99CH_3D1]
MAGDNEKRPTEVYEGVDVTPQSTNKADHDNHSSHGSTDSEPDLESQRRPSLHHTLTHISTHDAVVQPEHDEHWEEGDEVYERFTPKRKIIIVAILSFCSFLAPMSSTSILAAAPEVVATYGTTGTIFNISNALYMLFMGLSPLFWGPIGEAFGRKISLVSASITFTAFSAGSALAPNLAAYFVFRMLTAFQGTVFLIVGATAISDIYRPVERATAVSWFMSGTLIGPALGPLIGGAIVTYASWRDIFWLQTALAGAASLLCLFLLPETIVHRRSKELEGLSRSGKAKVVWTWINPMRVVSLWLYPNLTIAGLASSCLVWNMYSLLTPIRYVLNPRFGLEPPLQSGLFYIAPGCGYLIGTFFGGRWADYTVKKYSKRRGGRVPEDRLRSCLPAMGIVIPACMLVYGWSVEKAVGGIPLPVIAMFLQGLAQLFCFPSLNTYCLEVMPTRKSDVVAGNYTMRYVFGAAGSAAVLPIIDAIGVGWFSTISALFVALGAGGLWCVAIWGKDWRDKINEGKDESKL